jgi:hypothetical protein
VFLEKTGHSLEGAADGDGDGEARELVTEGAGR